MVRGVVTLPKGTGKTVRVGVFARGAKADEAKAAGADVVGAEDLLEIVQGGTIEFDRCIATPDMMGIVGRLGKVLGPKGLMPNPKLGTVTMNVAEAVKAAKGGQIEYRVEKAGIIHSGIGKASFPAEDLRANFDALLDALVKAKPSGAKGKYVQQDRRLVDDGRRHQGRHRRGGRLISPSPSSRRGERTRSALRETSRGARFRILALLPSLLSPLPSPRTRDDEVTNSTRSPGIGRIELVRPLGGGPLCRPRLQLGFAP